MLPYVVVREQVSNLETFRWLIVGFTSIIGLASGLVAQTTYRRLENRISSTPIEVILTRAVELVIGLLIANLLLAPIFLLPIPRQLLFIKPMVRMLGSVVFSSMRISLADTHGRSFSFYD